MTKTFISCFLLTRSAREIALFLCCAMMWLAPCRAFASLGGDLNSIEQDRKHVDGTMRITKTNRYTVYEITVASGTRVRQYIGPSGSVFGFAWEGPFFPELQQFLGTHFKEYSDSLRAEKPNFFRRTPLVIHRPDLMVEIGGHVGSYYGRAYIPNLVPIGSNAEDII